MAFHPGPNGEFDIQAERLIYDMEHPDAVRGGVGVFAEMLTEHGEAYNSALKHNAKFGGHREYPKCIEVRDGDGVLRWQGVADTAEHEAAMRSKWAPAETEDEGNEKETLRATLKAADVKTSPNASLARLREQVAQLQAGA